MYSSAAAAKSIMHQKVREGANTKGSPVFFELGPKIPSFSVFTYGKTKVGLAKKEGERKKGPPLPYHKKGAEKSDLVLLMDEERAPKALFPPLFFVRIFRLWKSGHFLKNCME